MGCATVWFIIEKDGGQYASGYRIYSNKRRGAYLIFRATSAALIRGRRLFKHCTRQIYFVYIFIQRYTFSKQKQKQKQKQETGSCVRK